jgi:potassium efflux system protein
LLSIWVAVYVSRLTRFFLDEDVLPRLSLPRGVPGAISTGIHYLIIAGAIVFGTAAAGLDFSNFAIVVGALSVGIGFGLQNIVNNFISGVILLFERPIQIGDNVQVGELVGTVKQIGIRASIVRTYDGSEVIVPNGDLIAQQVVNYTLSDRNRRLELLVGVAYGSDLDHAKATIEAALPSVENVIAEPPPMVLFQGFGESSLDFRVLFWIADYDKGLRTRSAVGMAIYRALNAAKIEIPFPQRDLHIRSAPGLSNATASAKDPPGAESAQ